VPQGWREGRLQVVCSGVRNARGWELAALKFLREARRQAARKSRPARTATRGRRRHERSGSEMDPVRVRRRTASVRATAAVTAPG
jgi:hypothetical protein